MIKVRFVIWKIKGNILESGFVQIKKGFVQIKKGFVQIKKGFVQIKKGFIQIKKGFIQIKKGFIQIKKGFVQFKKGFVQFKKGFVQFKKRFVQFKKRFVQFKNHPHKIFKILHFLILKTKTMSELALKLIKEAKEKRLTRLDLGNCGLKELPNKLFELVWLETLNISNEWYDYSIRNIQYSQNKGKKNEILKLNNKIKNLTQLKTLIINGDKENKWNIDDISFLENLKHLEHLSLGYSFIKDISPLKSLDKLQVLNLNHCIVEDIYPLVNLRNLKRLYLKLRRLEDIGVLEALESLEELFISSYRIQNFQPIKNLVNLKVIDLLDTKIDNLDILSNLINLKRINLSFTKIRDLYPLKSFVQSGLTIIQDFEITNPDIGLNRFGIGIARCDIINPPSFILDKGNEAILRYWQELENKETITNNQTKLIFVGNSRAGKTSLWQFLKDKIYNDKADSTHGIKTEIWDTETLGTEDNQNLAAHIWDFGGQEYYHATHRLFLADNAVYVLVWECDSNKQGTRLEQFKLDDDPNGEIDTVDLEHFPASYWLENIQYFAGKHCPVLIVQNKVDEEALKANYTEGGKNLPDCFHLSVKNAFEFQQGHQDFEESNMDFQRFKLRLLKELRKNATAFKLVKYYAQVREALEAKAKDMEYIAVSELKVIALQFDETPDLENLLAYLKSFTNTVLYFPQNDVLKDRLYLNPTHISRDIYKILNKQVRENKGKFDVAHIKTRLNLTDDQEAERLVALMREFDLIFEKSKTIKGEIKRQFITPQYLPKKEDLSDDIQFLMEGFSFETAFMIQFKSFVPRSLMLRFIANNGALSNQETYWRNGIIYKSPTTQSMIKVEYDHEALTFTICVQDKAKQTIDMQNIVEQFVRLENSDEHIKISNDGKTYVELRTIRKLQHKKSRGDIYENGELISLSKFDWLTQKIKTEEIMAFTLEQLKEKVRAFIQKARTQEAMDAIDTWAYENNQKQLKDDITVLKRSLTEVNRQSILGLLTFQEVSREQTRLSISALTLLDSIGEDKPKEGEDKKHEELPPIQQTKKTILFITSSPNNMSMPNVGRQLKAINDAYGNNENLYEIKMIGFVQPENLIGEIEKRKADIIHFFMHNDTEMGLYFENGNGDLIPIEPDDMASIFEIITESKKVECVVLNACNSYTHVEAIKPFVANIVYTNDFVPDGVSGGNNDTIASVFTRKFYEQVVLGKTYAAAVKRTNVDLKLSKMPLSKQNKKTIGEIYAISTQ